MTQRLRICPCELRDANAFVEKLHRHHKKSQGHRWSTAVEANEQVVGVAIVGRPVGRMVDQRKVVEAVRVCTDGTPNACSALYGAVCRQQRALGYEKAQTYILASEPGTSLRAAGWRPKALVRGREWDTPSRRRSRGVEVQTEDKVRWECPCSTLPDIYITTPSPRRLTVAILAGGPRMADHADCAGALAADPPDVMCRGPVFVNCCLCKACGRKVGQRHLDVCACPPGAPHDFCPDCSIKNIVGVLGGSE